MLKYWYLFNEDNDNNNVAIAQSPGDKTLVDWTKDIISLREIPFEFSVEPDKLLEDYLADDLGVPLMSERLMKIISKYLTGKEGLRWYNALVNYGDKKIIYYVPSFKEDLDVLNHETSLFNKETGGLIKASFSFNKINQFAFFPLPQIDIKLPFRLGLIVSDDIKKDIIKGKLTGVNFSRVSIIQECQ